MNVPTSLHSQSLDMRDGAERKPVAAIDRSKKDHCPARTYLNSKYEYSIFEGQADKCGHLRTLKLQLKMCSKSKAFRQR